MSHESYIYRCIELAKKGKGSVSPNPMVGCVIVHNEKIIGEGYHQKYGQAHAEVNAINSVEDKSLLSKSTLYVSLEPCAHFGKTPPCSDLIVQHKIPNVIIGCIDSFNEVSGRGIEKLKSAGVNVILGILEKECLELNKRFFTFHNKKRPYIILKWAQTKDGFIDIIRENWEVGVNWITQPETKLITHKWRTEEDAILVGYNTVIYDNPSLTARAVNGKNPKRIILGNKEDFNPALNIFKSDAETFFINNKSVSEICDELYKLEIQSVIIEGGRKTLDLFLKSNLWDEARVLVGDIEFHNGIEAPKLNNNPYIENRFRRDTIITYIND